MRARFSTRLPDAIRIIHHGRFLENVWQPLLSKSGLPYRKYHATRHTYATWLLSDGADSPVGPEADGARLGKIKWWRVRDS